jgi:hypothetical protein
VSGSTTTMSVPWFSGRLATSSAATTRVFFDVPIFVDASLAREPRLVMPGGAYHDAIVLDTAEWMRCERVQSIANLGARTSATGH